MSLLFDDRRDVMTLPELPSETTTDAYRRALRSLLLRVRPQRVQLGVDLLCEKIERLVGQGVCRQEAFARVHRRAAEQVGRQLVRSAEASRCRSGAGQGSGVSRRLVPTIEQRLAEPPVLRGPDFHCDAALGGLARWLRAAGYEADWWPGIEDDRLLDKTLDSAAIMLTTDRPLYERAIVRAGLVPAVLVPVSLRKRQQLRFVVERLQLPRRDPRCMACGGGLVPVEKEAVRERIPPRTYPWQDDYYVCRRCDKLFWRGTHWETIDRQLAALDRPTTPCDR